MVANVSWNIDYYLEYCFYIMYVKNVLKNRKTFHQSGMKFKNWREIKSFKIYTQKSNIRSLSLNEDNFFFKFKKIFPWVTLRMYYETAEAFISLIQRKKQARNFFESKKLFSDHIAICKFAWFKETFFRVWDLTEQHIQKNAWRRNFVIRESLDWIIFAIWSIESMMAFNCGLLESWNKTYSEAQLS